jgi:hypothetical protein
MSGAGADLRALANQVVSSLRHPAIRAAFTTIVAAAMQDPAARELLSRFIAARVATMPSSSSALCSAANCLLTPTPPR